MNVLASVKNALLLLSNPLYGLEEERCEIGVALVCLVGKNYLRAIEADIGLGVIMWSHAMAMCAQAKSRAISDFMAIICCLIYGNIAELWRDIALASLAIIMAEYCMKATMGDEIKNRPWRKIAQHVVAVIGHVYLINTIIMWAK